MSQQKLAKAIGLTFQQIQKYERGTNRMSASRLYQLADVLNISILDFYAGLGGVQSDLHIWHSLKAIPDDKICKTIETLIHQLATAGN